MSAERELNSLNAAAGNAATAGDFAGAVALLRQALEQQTATLGPDHPDLATTLNNLALMLEQIGDTAEAGRCYRRAYAIALAALGPDDPAVGVSHANLAAFYRAHGSSGDEVEQSMLAGLQDFPSVDVAKGTVIAAAPRPAQILPPPPPATPPAPSPRPVENRATASRRASRAAVIGTAVVLLTAAGWWALPPGQPTRRADQAPATRRPADESMPPGAASVPPPAPSGTTPTAAAVSPPAAPEKEPAGVDASRSSAHNRTAALGASSAAVSRVAEARLCGALSRDRGAWRCQPLAQPRRGGAVYFYTRVASSTDAIIRHRWTRNGNVVRVVDLRIRANPKEGFRTYSRQTGRALEAGEWQVALLDPTGAVLQEEAFVIR